PQIHQKSEFEVQQAFLMAFKVPQLNQSCWKAERAVSISNRSRLILLTTKLTSSMQLCRSMLRSESVLPQRPPPMLFHAKLRASSSVILQGTSHRSYHHPGKFISFPSNR